MAKRPTAWCPKCKKYVKTIHKLLDGNMLKIEYRKWDGEKYQEMKDMVRFPHGDIFFLCSKCNTQVLFKNKTIPYIKIK